MKFKGFLNPLTEAGRVAILRNTIKDAGVGQVRKQVISIKTQEIKKIVRKLIKKGYTPVPLPASVYIYNKTIEKWPLFKEFFEIELGLDKGFWMHLIASTISGEKKDEQNTKTKQVRY